MAAECTSNKGGKGPKRAQKGAPWKGKGKPWGKGLKGKGKGKGQDKGKGKGLYGLATEYDWNPWGTDSWGNASDWGPHACAWGEEWPKLEQSGQPWMQSQTGQPSLAYMSAPPGLRTRAKAKYAHGGGES